MKSILLSILFLLIGHSAAFSQEEDKLLLQQQLLLSKGKQAEIARENAQKAQFEKQKAQLAEQEKQLLKLGLVKKEADLQKEYSASQAMRLQTKYDAAVKDKYISSQQSDIRQNRRWIIYLTSISLLTLIGAVIIYLNQRKTRRLNALITEQHNELAQIGGVKDKLLTIVGHDMRSPLSMLLGLSQILQQEDVPKAKIAAYMKQLESTLTHTSSMMDNLLYWAASQMQGYKPVISDFSIAEIVGDVILLQEVKANQKGLALRQELCDGLMVRCDFDMLTLVIRNLLSNSIKFTPPGGSIVVSSSQDNGNAIISVIDTGVGLSQVYVDRFNSTTLTGIESTQGTDKEKGTGLGLLLCQTFTRLMNGHMIALVNPNGNGTVFKIILPHA